MYQLYQNNCDDIAMDIIEDVVGKEEILKTTPNCGYANGASMKACVKCGHLLD